jgi:hypothetical protein
MGMAVFAGMLIATILGVFLVPTLFVAVERVIGSSEAHPTKAVPPQPEVARESGGGAGL